MRNTDKDGGLRKMTTKIKRKHPLNR